MTLTCHDDPLCTRDPACSWAAVDPHAALWRRPVGQSVFVAADLDERTMRRDGTLPGLSYVYGDRLEWPLHDIDADGIKARRTAAEAASATLSGRTARCMSVYLSELWARPVEVAHVRLGVQAMNGYTWAVFGWRPV